MLKRRALRVVSLKSRIMVVEGLGRRAQVLVASLNCIMRQELCTLGVAVCARIAKARVLCVLCVSAKCVPKRMHS